MLTLYHIPLSLLTVTYFLLGYSWYVQQKNSVFQIYLLFFVLSKSYKIYNLLHLRNEGVKNMIIVLLLKNNLEVYFEFRCFELCSCFNVCTFLTFINGLVYLRFGNLFIYWSFHRINLLINVFSFSLYITLNIINNQ